MKKSAKKLNKSIKKQISETIERDHPELKSLNNAHLVRSFGTPSIDTAKTAEIRFKPHAEADNGAPLFYQMECNLNRTLEGWACEQPIEKRGGYYAARDDHYLMDDNTEGKTAEKIAHLLHEELVTNKVGYFRYTEGTQHGKEGQSIHALDIVKINHVDGSNMFRIDLDNFDRGCLLNIVEVREDNCDAENQCAYSIVSSIAAHIMMMMRPIELLETTPSIKIDGVMKQYQQ